MDRNAFKQIQLSTDHKLRIVVAWMNYIRKEPKPVPRSAETDKEFIRQTEEPTIARLRDTDTWLPEHVARLFWTCADMGLLEYQYPYPHNCQSYAPTRLGRLVGAAPAMLSRGLLRCILMFEMIAGPIKHFTKVRNTVGAATALITLWSNPQVQATTVAVYTLVAAVISTWVAHFLTSGDN